MLVKKSNKNETLIYGTILFFFSTIYNQHFGNIGVFPIDDDAWTDIGQWTEYRKVLDQL